MAEDRMRDDDLERKQRLPGRGEPGQQGQQGGQDIGGGQNIGQRQKGRDMEDDEDIGTAGQTGGQPRGGQNR